MQHLGESAEVVSQVLKTGISSLMNLAPNQGGETPSSSPLSSTISDIYFVNFNQDYTSISVGSKSGYRLYPLSSVDKIESIYENSTEDISIVERLFSSSLLATVSLSSPRKLKVCHFKKGSEICNFSYSNTILALKLNRMRLVVCLEESLYIHNIKDMKIMHTIRETPSNPTGICALSSGNENCLLAYPGNNTTGEVQIFDADNLQANTMIPAHDNPLAALAFNTSGTQIATASKKGTVIRVFLIADGSKLFEFRRGVKRCVTIYSLAFSNDSNFLCASSNTETVHIFKLEPYKESNPGEENQGWMGYVGKALMSSANYLPTQVTDMFSQGRAFATVHLPFSGLKNVCCVTTIQRIIRVLVASVDGYLYIYNMDSNDGGDCTLIKQHKLEFQVVQPPSSDQVGTTSTSSSSPTPSLNGGGFSLGPGYATTGISYSAAVRKSEKGGQCNEMDYMREMVLAAELDTIDNDGLRLDDHNEFPPM